MKVPNYQWVERLQLLIFLTKYSSLAARIATTAYDHYVGHRRKQINGPLKTVLSRYSVFLTEQSAITYPWAQPLLHFARLQRQPIWLLRLLPLHRRSSEFPECHEQVIETVSSLCRAKNRTIKDQVSCMCVGEQVQELQPPRATAKPALPAFQHQQQVQPNPLQQPLCLLTSVPDQGTRQ